MNFNVRDLDASVKFYEDTLGLKIIRSVENEEKGFKIAFLGYETGGFLLELTWLKAHEEAYDLGEQEFHLAFTAEDFPKMYKKHKEMGIIVYDNEDMGIYFLEDPDGYWLEIIPKK